ncbi:MAG: hypothetical protein CM15mP6_0050 [Methanobacteriota archaeon]|nr:MAG: hypothetical protein CM15mP6_0050 [Euryarchaeota archaeon]
MKNDFIDAIQSDNDKLRGILTGKESVSTKDDFALRVWSSIPVLLRVLKARQLALDVIGLIGG